MWTDGNGFFYEGDMRQGDRAATEQEVAAYLLDRSRASRLAEVGAEFLARSRAGFVYNGHTYQLDDSSQRNIAALGTRAGFVEAGINGSTWPDGFVFIAGDNSMVPFTAPQFLVFALAASDQVIALRLAYRALKDDIMAAADQAALDVIDTSVISQEKL